MLIYVATHRPNPKAPEEEIYRGTSWDDAKAIMRRKLGFTISQMTDDELAGLNYTKNREGLIDARLKPLTMPPGVESRGDGFYFAGGRYWATAVNMPDVEEPNPWASDSPETELAKKARVYAASVTKLMTARREEAAAYRDLKAAMDKGEQA